jgi:4-amino-4-deoxy-L-arabinose transferase-like glycosyltransferase
MLVLAVILLAAVVARLLWLDTIPPGMWFDEAVDAHDALGVWHGGFEIYFEGNLGREPLYMYLLAPAVGLFGPGAVPIRLVSGVLGLAAVALTYPLGRALFDRRVALFATGFAAASYPLLHFSRTGFRVITLPALLVLGLWLAWTGLRRDRLGLTLAGGAALGLTLYTYSSSRYMLPPLLGALALIGLWRRDLPAGRRLRLVGTLVAAAVVVCLPLLVYYATHLSALSVRANQIPFVNPLAGRDALRDWYGSTLDVLRMFFVSGDGLARHNLPGRPMLDPLAGAALVLGALILLLERRWAVALLLGTWLVATLGPLTFTLENPHHLRSLGVLPVLFLLCGLGLARVVGYLRVAGPLLAGLVLVLSAASTARDYFVVWPEQTRTFWETQADVAAAVRALPGLPSADRVFVAADEYRSRPEPFTALHGEDDRVHAFNGRKGLVFPDPGLGTALYLMPTSATADRSVVERLLPAGALVSRSPAPDGADAFRAYRLPAAELQPHPTHPLRASFGGVVELLGYDLAEATRPGQPAALTLYWRILEYRWYPWSWRAQLVDARGQGGIGQAAYSDSLITNAWRLNDVVASWMEVPPPRTPDAGAGFVVLTMKTDGREEAADVPATDASGRDAGTTLRLGPLRLRERPPDQFPPDLTATRARFGDAIELVGYRLRGPVRAGAPLPLTLAWRATGTPAASYSYTLQLLAADGRLVAQQDGQPGGGDFPTAVWQAGDVVVDSAQLSLPPGTTGPLRLIVALYEQPSLKRLPTGGADFATLATFPVAP